MTEPPIPFNRPAIAGAEFDHMRQALAAGRISGDGELTRQASRILERETGAAKALLTTSCTHALEMAALLLDLRAGDEVLIPSFAFVSCANAFVLRGAQPVFVDIRRDTLNLDEKRLAERIGPRTRAILALHYAGVACEMDSIREIARDANLAIVEDNAHGLFGSYREKPLGSFGDFATLSFHETKNITSGEGGALLLNDARWIERAEILREKGTNRSRFFRGEVDRYGWVDLGSSYLPSDLLAGFLLGQLERRGEIQAERQAIWARYRRDLGDWALRLGIGTPHVPEHCSHPAHIFYLLLRDNDQRQSLIDHLRRRGVHSVFHYLPLHLSPMGRRFGARLGDCPVTEEVSEQLLRLPIFRGLEGALQDRVIEAVLSFNG